jgi:hypothetical protein
MSWAAVAAAGVSVAGSMLSKDSSGGSSGAGQVAQGAANIAGGALSANEAQQFGNQLAQTANPFGQYNQQYASQLNQASPAILSSNYGAYTPTANFAANTAGNNSFAQGSQNFANQTAANPYALGANTMNQFTANSTNPLTSSLNGAQLGGQIQNLVNDPSSVYNTPQYKAAFGQGQNAVNATLAAQGLNASGNQLAALQNYGQTFGQNAYNTQLSQLSGLYGQALGANQQQYSQLSGNAAAGLAENQNAFQQQTAAGQLGLAQNQQQYSQLLGAGQLGLNQNQQTFNQLAQMSGLSSGSPTAAAAAMSNVYSNVNSAYQGVGQGIGQLASGAGNILNGLSNGTTSGVNQYGFSSGLGDMSNSTTGFGDVSGSGSLFGTSAGLGGDGFNYSGGGNTWGF